MLGTPFISTPIPAPSSAPISTLAPRIVQIDPLRDTRWGAFVAAHPEATIHHHPLWLQLLADAFGYPAAHLACEDDAGRLRGVLPLFVCGNLLLGRRFSSLPRTPVAGPLAIDPQATTALLDAAVEWVWQERASLQLKLAAPLEQPIDGLSGGAFRPTYIIPLPARDQPVTLGDARRRHRVTGNVKKAVRLGVEVREAETEAELRAWHALYLETMRYRFVPPRPYHFFAHAWHLLRPAGLLRVLLAEQRSAAGTRLLAGGVFLQYGESVFYGFAGSRRDTLELRPNDALQWHAICAAHQAGYRFYDMGEVSANNAGLATYKQKWGAEQRWLYRYYFPTSDERELGLLEAEGRAARMAHAAWQHVPLPMTEVVSRVLHRYL